MVRKITSPVTLQCNITVHDTLKVWVKFFRPSKELHGVDLTGVKSLTPTALAHKCLWKVKKGLPQWKNTPDDSQEMVTYSIESGIISYAISVQICWQSMEKYVCAIPSASPTQILWMTCAHKHNVTEDCLLYWMLLILHRSSSVHITVLMYFDDLHWSSHNQSVCVSTWVYICKNNHKMPTFKLNWVNSILDILYTWTAILSFLTDAKVAACTSLGSLVAWNKITS